MNNSFEECFLSTTQTNEDPSKPMKSGQLFKKKKIALNDELQNDGQYHWSNKQQRQYVRFLVARRKLFEMSLQQKKKKGIHNKMSKILKTRNAQQCRSHHQKMIAKYGSIEAIVNSHAHLISNIPQKQYQSLEVTKLEITTNAQNISENISSVNILQDQKEQEIFQDYAYSQCQYFCPLISDNLMQERIIFSNEVHSTFQEYSTHNSIEQDKTKWFTTIELFLRRDLF